MKRQKGKHHKRRKSWHRGRAEAKRWRQAMRLWPTPEPKEGT